MKQLLLSHPGLKEHFLQIAQGRVFQDPTAVSTILGSCVSVTFFCRSTRIGGIFHALLPDSRLRRKQDEEYTPYRYVDTAVSQILKRMLANGAQLADIECKLFGGGSARLNGEFSVGRDNVSAAFAALSREGRVAAASDVGGAFSRKLVFLTHTGEVFIRRFSAGEAERALAAIGFGTE